MTTCMLRSSALTLAILGLVAQGCNEGSTEGPLGIGVNYKDGPGLPAEVTRLVITITPYAATSSSCRPSSGPVQGEFMVADMTDLDSNGYREAVLSDLPYGCPLFVEVDAHDASSVVRYSGRADGVTLVEGERRFVQMTLMPEGSVSLLGSTLDEPVFGLAATALAEQDGRVLLTGGFTGGASTACPTLYADAQYHCFALTATARAYVFDQGSATPRPVAAGDMMEPRAMHTATRLADGRVLVAGGVKSATMVIRDDPLAPSWAGYEIVDIVPTASADVLNTFELFDPEAGAAASDPERDGDLAAGDFVGSSDNPAVVGRLNFARFGHSAVIMTSTASSINGYRVHLSGGFGPQGIGDPNVARSIDVFSMDSVAGGYDFLSGLPLSAARHTAPSSVFLDGFAWELGGAAWPGSEGHSNANVTIVERWQPNTDGDEWSVGPVLFNGFDDAPRPELVRLFARALEVGAAGNTAAVVGWYGARCNDLTAGTPTPTYEYLDTDGTTPIPTWICPPSVTPDFTLTTDAVPPAIVPDVTRVDTPHGLGEAIRLASGARAGQVLVIGGISDVSFTTTDAVDVYESVDLTGELVQDAVLAMSMNNERALCAAAEMNGGNVLIAGGVQFDLVAGTLTLLDTVEYLNW